MLAIATFLVLASQARTIAQLEELCYEGPEATLDGVTCGSCSKYERSCGRPAVKHASVAHVRYCHALAQQIEDESRAEHSAELAVERYFEERGSQDDPRERELWAMEDYLRGL